MVEADAAAPGVLAAIHRHVGSTDEGVEVGAVGGEHRHADTRAHAHRLGHAVQRLRLARGLKQPLGGGRGLLPAVDARQQDQKLVAAHSTGDIGLAQRGAQPRRDGHQQHVAGRMAELVVDGLELIQVDEQQCHRTLLAARARGLVREQLAQQRAVGQSGQVVVHRQPLELRVLVLELVDQRPDLPLHAAQVMAELAELVVAPPVGQRPRLARRQAAGLSLERVDRPQQPQRQHAGQHRDPEADLRRDQPGRDAPPLGQRGVDLAAVEGQPQARDPLPLVQHRGLESRDLVARGAAIHAQGRGLGLQLEHLDAAHRGFVEHPLHRRAQPGLAERPRRLGQHRVRQHHDRLPVAFDDRLLRALGQVAVQRQDDDRGQDDADHDAGQHRGTDRQAGPAHRGHRLSAPLPSPVSTAGSAASMRASQSSGKSALQ